MQRLLKFAYHQLKFLYFVFYYILRFRKLPIHPLFLPNKKISYSQFGQDVILMQLIGVENLKKTFVIELGANDPKFNSNSLLLEKNGAKGCAYDLLDYKERWLSRQFDFCNTAVTADGRDVEVFVAEKETCWEDQMSGLAAVNRSAAEKFQGSVNKMTSLSINEIMYRPHFAKYFVLLMDIEGAELELLNALGACQHLPDYILLENNRSNRSEIHACLQKMGYKLQKVIWTTDELWELSA